MTNIRIILLGATGFIGGSLRRYLSARDYNVVATSRQNTAHTDALVDILDQQSLRDVFKAGDVVINAAGYAQATDTTTAGAKLFNQTNVQALRFIIAAAEGAGISHLVHISSVAAMGRLEGREITVGMDAPVVTPYAKSKREGERYLKTRMNTLPITILRPTSVFGEGRVLTSALCRASSLPIIPLPGGGYAEIPFTYIDNVCKAIALTLNKSECFGQTFIVGDERSYALKDIIGALARGLGRSPRVVPVPIALAKGGAWLLEAMAKIRNSPPLMDRTRLATLTKSASYSIDEFQSVTGYRPSFTLEQACERIAAWYLKKCPEQS